MADRKFRTFGDLWDRHNGFVLQTGHRVVSQEEEARYPNAVHVIVVRGPEPKDKNYEVWVSRIPGVYFLDVTSHTALGDLPAERLRLYTFYANRGEAPHVDLSC